MHRNELKAVASIGLIMAFRMLGLFMILPVFSVAAAGYAHATPTLIGLALGVYGLTQAALQIPFGSLSDRIGRKPVICIGLLLFAAGSVVAALSHSIAGIILGRALQGAGAIGSTALALVSDLTRDEQRTKAMALVGISIGLAFSLALVLGPLINQHFHLNGIFWATGGFALFAIGILFTTIPNPPKPCAIASKNPKHSFKAVISNPHLIRLDLSIFLQHALLIATFLAIPLVLTRQLHLSPPHQVIIYLIVLVLSFLAMIPFVIIAEKKRQMHVLMLSAIGLLTLTQLLWLIFPSSIVLATILLFLFFMAFNFLESCLPSLVSKTAPLANKGAAMGVYSTSQFLGIFFGGILGGLMLHHGGTHSVFLLCLAISALWLVIVSSMGSIQYGSTLTYTLAQGVKEDNPQLSELSSAPGILDYLISTQEGLLYLKVDKTKIDINELRKQLEAGNLV